MKTSNSPLTAPDPARTRLLQKVFRLPTQWGTAKMTHRRIQNYTQALSEHAAGALELSSLPIRLTVESTNICNLRCVACPTGVGRHGRERGHMSVELFSWLMSELAPTLFEVELHNWGEPLLGRNVYKFIEMASAAGVSTSISTNFSIPFDEERAERLVSSGLAVLGVSIDGATQETYEKYRVRGDLSRILDNCRMVAEAKRRLGSPTPELFWSYHAFSFNAQEVELARQRAADIGMRFAVTRGWVIGPEEAGLETFPYPWGGGFPDRCFFLWFQAVVNNEGGISPCCGTFYAEEDFDRLALDPDSLGRASFRRIWNGTNFVAARRMFFRREGDERERRLACFDCPVTADFDGWKAAIRDNAREFKKASSNDSYNFFWNRGSSAGPGLVRLRRSADAG